MDFEGFWGYIDGVDDWCLAKGGGGEQIRGVFAISSSLSCVCLCCMRLESGWKGGGVVERAVVELRVRVGIC